LPQIIRSNINSLKIEGRNKSAYYIANVTRMYRNAIDTAYTAGENYIVQDEWRRELTKISHREYTTGFAFGPPGRQGQRYITSDPIRGYDFVAMILSIEQGRLLLEQRNHFATGDILELLLPDGGQVELRASLLYDQGGQSVKAAAHPGMRVYLPLTYEQQQTLARYVLPLVARRAAR
jgi:putative protease